MTLLPVLLLLLQNPEPGVIEGIVTRGSSSAPVARARLVLTKVGGSSIEMFSATSTGEGRFVFRNLQPGTYTLAATKDGYVRTEYGQRGPGRRGMPIVLASGQSLNGITLGLIPTGVIHGRVSDRYGEPAINNTVQALKYSYQEGRRTLTIVQTDTTNDLGEYRLFSLQPGQFYVRVMPRPQNPRVRLPDGQGASAELSGASETGAIVYFPNTPAVESASAVNLRAGEIIGGVDLTLIDIPVRTVRGRVINGVTAEPALNVTITLRHRNSLSATNFMTTRSTAPAGTFEIVGVVPGSYYLVATLADRTSRQTARVPIEVGGTDLENVVILLNPGYTITGRVNIDGQPLNNNSQERLNVSLRPEAATPTAPPPATVLQDGTFTISNVAPDEYIIYVTGAPPGAYLKDAKFGGVAVLDDQLVVDSEPRGPLEIVIGTNPGTIEGTVFDASQRPAASVMVTIVPDLPFRGRIDLSRGVPTDSSGRFRFTQVAPGAYKVFAWEDIEPGAWQDPEFIRMYEEHGQVVRIGEGGRASIQLRTISP
ncbi:MAG: carboxypeptidase regulatory-like domain-containing protein [Acidobacteria bacterium]|nr:carboxypeptidase regulatory-like domain-containing protein [Acidobacteriota bacterium]